MAAETPHELMSITKGAVGLAFAASGRDWSHEVFCVPGASSADPDCITVLDALNHATGIEDDANFDWKTFYLEYAKKDPQLVNYCKHIFFGKKAPITTEKYANKKKFAYNNVAWRILVEHFTHGTGGQTIPEAVGVTGPGVLWDTDLTGACLGARGMKLSPGKLGEYAHWASGVLRGRWGAPGALDALPAAACPVPKTHWIQLAAGDPADTRVYAWHGWFFTVPKTAPRAAVAFSPGYRAQYVCIDIQPGILAPETQYQENPDAEPTEDQLNFVRRYAHAVFEAARLFSATQFKF